MKQTKYFLGRFSLPLLVMAVAATFLFSFAGCKSPERTAITAGVASQSSVDVALNLWATGWERRYAANEATARADPSGHTSRQSGLLLEHESVGRALEKYQAAYTAAVNTWLLIKQGASTNGLTTSGLASFSSEFAVAEADVLALIQSFGK